MEAEWFGFKVVEINENKVTIEVTGNFDAGSSFNRMVILKVGEKFSVSSTLSINSTDFDAS